MAPPILVSLLDDLVGSLSTDHVEDDQTSFWAHAHRWTLSRHLWEADSSFEFARMWREKPQFVITNYKFEDFLQYGRGEDVDELGEIFLTV